MDQVFFLLTLLPHTPLRPDEFDRKPKPWQEAMVALLAGVEAAPMSELAWKAARPDLASLDGDIWLLCLLHEEALHRKRSVDVHFEPVTTDSERLSGIIRIIDVQISKVRQCSTKALRLACSAWSKVHLSASSLVHLQSFAASRHSLRLQTG